MWIGVLIWIMFRHLGRKERSRFLICVGVGWDGIWDEVGKGAMVRRQDRRGNNKNKRFDKNVRRSMLF